ncbi:MAG TPA: CaiB/BaiF CoA-transferase family protein, partial [Rhizomicrobium sp.]|nr:CaiB/BaiF CoA-transferase family protein [Rhizomicrobium sp.]
LANQAMNYLSGGMVPKRLGNAHPNIVPYQVFETADGHLILAIANDGQFKRFCGAAGLAHLSADPRYATNATRVDHREELVALLKPVLAARGTSDWIATLEKANVPCGPINRIDQVFADPQAVARELTVPMTHSQAGNLNLVASPLRLEKTPPEYRNAPPLLGEHTREILSQVLMLAPADIDALAKAGIAGVR